jgi:hypothetical protein
MSGQWRTYFWARSAALTKETHSAERLLDNTIDAMCTRSNDDEDERIVRLRQIADAARRRAWVTRQNYARVLAQPYTTRLNQNLPRELRDMIYQYFQLPANKVSVFATTLGEISFVDNAVCYNYYEVYEWDIGYLSPDVVSELAPPWYSFSEFILGEEDV